MFEFKQFTIHQDRTPMKVGTDGVLLGAWVGLRGDERHILDIGCGTGLISLMMAQRCSSAQIDGVEIDEASAVQASENVAASPWPSRVAIHCAAVQSFGSERLYDLIISNPPFFVGSLHSPDERRTASRHTTSLNFEELAAAAARLLNAEGRFAVILPTVEAQRFDAEAQEVGLHLARRMQVRSSLAGGIKRVMSEYRFASTEQPIFEEIAISSSERNYTEKYRDLTREFYLKF